MITQRDTLQDWAILPLHVDHDVLERKGPVTIGHPTVVKLEN